MRLIVVVFCLSASTANAGLMATITNESAVEAIPVSMKLRFVTSRYPDQNAFVRFEVSNPTPGVVYQPSSELLAQLDEYLTTDSPLVELYGIGGEPPPNAVVSFKDLVTGSPREPFLYRPQPFHTIVRNVPMINTGFVGYDISAITQEVSEWTRGTDLLYRAVQTVKIFGDSVPEPTSLLLFLLATFSVVGVRPRLAG